MDGVGFFSLAKNGISFHLAGSFSFLFDLIFFPFYCTISIALFAHDRDLSASMITP